MNLLEVIIGIMTTEVIEIFKTNVTQHHTADVIVQQLIHQFPELRVNFDLADCDNILRVQGPEDKVQRVVEL